MAEFEVIYPDSKAIYDLSATPTTKSTLNSAGLSVQEGSSDTSASIGFNVVSVQDIGAFVASTVETNRMLTQNSDNSTNVEAHSDGTLKINKDAAINSQMDVSGVQFTTSSGTDRLSANGLGFKAETAAFSVDDGTSQTIIAGASIGFSLDAPMSPLVQISSADGVSIQSGPFQPDELWDISGNAGDAGQYLLASGSGGPPVWTTISAPGTPNLAAVLAATPDAGDGNNLPITNVSQVAIHLSGVGQTPLTVSSAASTSASPVAATYDVLSSSQSYDGTSARSFQNKYMEVVLNGTHYWIPLFI